MIKVFDPQGTPQFLGDLLAKGGEGSVYPLQSRPEVLVKVYHPEIISKRGKSLKEKIEAMCKLSELRNERSLAWPLLSVYDENKNWIGYAMYCANGKPMFKLAHAILYKKNFPGLDRKRVVSYLLNLIDLTIFLHSRGVMIGDCNLQNILCDPQSDAVTLIDCDSYQFVIGQKFYPCPVGMPDMTAKEQHGSDFSTVRRTTESEAFSIAIVLFMSLMLGRHPYDIKGGSERAENLRKGDFAYGKGDKVARGRIPEGPWYNIWSHMPHKVKSLFIQTFIDGADDPSRRATLNDWKKTLSIYRDEINKNWHEISMEPQSPKTNDYRGQRSVNNN